MSFLNLIDRLKPANKNLNYMDVKEKSELMEAAHAAAAHHVMIFFKAKKDWETACAHYERQCREARVR